MIQNSYVSGEKNLLIDFVAKCLGKLSQPSKTDHIFLVIRVKLIITSVCWYVNEIICIRYSRHYVIIKTVLAKEYVKNSYIVKSLFVFALSFYPFICNKSMVRLDEIRDEFNKPRLKCSSFIIDISNNPLFKNALCNKRNINKVSIPNDTEKHMISVSCSFENHNPTDKINTLVKAVN